MKCGKVVDVKDFENFSGFFRGEKGHRRAEWIMKRLSIDKVNYVHETFGNNSGPGFTSRLLDYIDARILIGNANRLSSLPQGAFITISNHPYGGLDGIISIDLFAGMRPDYKFMVNDILSRISAMKENFITVTPTGNKKTGISGTSLRGVRETMEHIRKGHPAGFFPSGAVSDFSLKTLRVRDRKWQTSILHLIRSARVPILPVRFFDKNTAFFYALGLIHWKIRLLRLPSEVFNKKDRNIRIGIGRIIPVSEQEQYPDPETFGIFLRKTVYEMPLPDTFIPKKNLTYGVDKPGVTV